MTRTVIYHRHLWCFHAPGLRHSCLEWLSKKGVHPKASKSKEKSGRPDCFNYFGYMSDVGKNTSCSTALGCKLFTSAGIADEYTFLMNTWKHYQRATNSGWIKILLLQSSVRSHRQRTQRLPWSSGWKQRGLTLQLFLTICSPMGRLRSLRLQSLTLISW